MTTKRRPRKLRPPTCCKECGGPVAVRLTPIMRFRFRKEPDAAELFNVECSCGNIVAITAGDARAAA